MYDYFILPKYTKYINSVSAYFVKQITIGNKLQNRIILVKLLQVPGYSFLNS